MERSALIQKADRCSPVHCLVVQVRQNIQWECRSEQLELKNIVGRYI